MTIESQIYEDSRLRLILDFETIDVDELAELLTAVRSIAFRSLIQFLRTQEPNNQFRSLSWLSISYRNYIESRYRDMIFFPEFHYRRRWNPDFEFHYETEEEPPFFEEWTRYLARKYKFEIRSIEFGSYDFAIYIAGLLYLAGPTDWNVNYSLAKDAVNQCIHFLRNGISHPRPKGHLEAVPEIVETLAANPRITKLEVHANGESIDVKAEFQKRKR